METKQKRIALFLVIYIVLLWVGFKSGTVYARMRNKLAVEKVYVPSVPKTEIYYIVSLNKMNEVISYDEVDENSTVMKIYFNNELRPILKGSNIVIYDWKGNKLYQSR